MYPQDNGESPDLGTKKPVDTQLSLSPHIQFLSLSWLLNNCSGLVSPKIIHPELSLKDICFFPILFILLSLFQLLSSKIVYLHTSQVFLEYGDVFNVLFAVLNVASVIISILPLLRKNVMPVMSYGCDFCHQRILD